MLLDELLRSRRDDIVTSFVKRARSEHPSGTSEASIVDHVPTLIDELADAVETGRTSLPPAKLTSKEHARARWQEGMDMRTLVREYAILRSCVLEITGRLIDDLETVDRFFNSSIANAVTEFAAVAESHATKLREQLREENLRLERARASLALLSDVGAVLASTSNEPRQLFKGVAELCARSFADCCSIYISEGVVPSLLTVVHRVPEKSAIVREIYERFPTTAEALHESPATIRGGRGDVVRGATDETYMRLARTPEHLALVREVGAVSWIVVPLRIAGGESFGAMALLNAESGRQFSDEDFSLAEEIARRLALVVDHARLFEAARRERARAEVATRAKDEFLAVVSHELRTPLNAILGWTRMIRPIEGLPEKVLRGLEVIERNASAQAQLIGDMLDVSRIVTGNVRLEIGSVDISSLVEMSVEAVRPAADAKSIHIEEHFDPETGVVRGDPVRLQQVVWNLLSNAVKFTPKRGRMSVTVKRVSSDVEIIVEDDGEGIDAAGMDMIFERFRQEDASSSRNFGGMGLGLAIARHLVELHGGKISATSPGRGKGATFTVRIPLSPLTTTAVTRPVMRAGMEHASRSADDAKVAGMTVLVVEDEEDARDLLGELLTRAGVEVKTASSVAAGFEEFLRFRPEVVVSDIGMPIEDGYALARKIRALSDAAGGNTPLIALTAYSSNDDRARARLEGFSAHTAKPVEPSTLLDLLASFRFRAH
jgi:signal transduction histidine kinase/CheY-like chemotaxis protein